MELNVIDRRAAKTAGHAIQASSSIQNTSTGVVKINSQEVMHEDGHGNLVSLKKQFAMSQQHLITIAGALNASQTGRKAIINPEGYLVIERTTAEFLQGAISRVRGRELGT